MRSLRLLHYVNAWQLDRFRMALFAWLTGARRVVLLDTEHAGEEFGAARLLVRELPRTVLSRGPGRCACAVARAQCALVGPRAGLLGETTTLPDAPASSERTLDVLLVRPTPTIGVMEAGESAPYPRACWTA
ncbi:MAG: hypothetical protein IPF82_23300 [Blastocatellia bacterium]|nr:hypothetical protein [Blastocatellia bacterium]